MFCDAANPLTSKPNAPILHVQLCMAQFLSCTDVSKAGRRAGCNSCLHNIKLTYECTAVRFPMGCAAGARCLEPSRFMSPRTAACLRCWAAAAAAASTPRCHTPPAPADRCCTPRDSADSRQLRLQLRSSCTLHVREPDRIKSLRLPCGHNKTVAVLACS